MFLVWDPTTTLKFSFKISRSHFVGGVENSSLKHGNSEIRRARKTLVVVSLLLHGGLAQPKWHWPAFLKIGICLVEMFVPFVYTCQKKERYMKSQSLSTLQCIWMGRRWSKEASWEEFGENITINFDSGMVGEIYEKYRDIWIRYLVNLACCFPRQAWRPQLKPSKVQHLKTRCSKVQHF